VRDFARGEQEDFESLALDISRYQARWSPGHAQLAKLRGAPEHLDAIPAVPADAFRVTRVAIHPAEADVVRFATSGTTSGARGIHALRTTATYDALALGWGERALGSESRTVIALAPDPGPTPTSSLAYMLRLFMQRFAPGHAENWLLTDQGVDLDALRSLLQSDRSKPALILATSFALVELLDRLGGSTLPTPEGSVVMQTGGFKGKTREVDADELRASVARTFAVPSDRIVSEYGMTELTSQLYDFPKHGAPGLYRAPAWLRVSAVDPATLQPVAPGEPGFARFVDLGNVDSAVAIVTQDIVRVTEDGVELVGRQTGATPRGCSLAIEELLAARKPSA
jgi:hypothetical protein